MAAATVLAGATALLPPLGPEARRMLWAEGVQFVILATAVPFLATMALGPRVRGALVRTGSGWLALIGGVQVGALVAWRVPASVDALVHQPWLGGAEAVTLLVAGIGLWSHLLAGGPGGPGVSTPSYALRIVMAAVAMWTIWILGYLAAFSRVGWYPAYLHLSGLSMTADQQLATAVLFAGSAAAFLPPIFWSLVGFLRDDGDAGSHVHLGWGQGARG